MTIRSTLAGGASEVEVSCAVCQASNVAAVGPGDRGAAAIAVGLEHTPRCPVPHRLELARAAYRN